MTDTMAGLTRAEWDEIAGRAKPPCRHPLPGGQRCCECASCHPTPAEMLAWVRRDMDGTVEDPGDEKRDDKSALKGTIERLIDERGRWERDYREMEASREAHARSAARFLDERNAALAAVEDTGPTDAAEIYKRQDKWDREARLREAAQGAKKVIERLISPLAAYEPDPYVQDWSQVNVSDANLEASRAALVALRAALAVEDERSTDA